jgi:hypothetical protein
VDEVRVGHSLRIRLNHLKPGLHKPRVNLIASLTRQDVILSLHFLGIPKLFFAAIWVGTLHNVLLRYEQVWRIDLGIFENERGRRDKVRIEFCVVTSSPLGEIWLAFLVDQLGFFTVV